MDYFSDFKKLVRTDPLNRVVLLALKDQHKEHPILPLESDDIEAFKGSPLYSSADTPEDLSETISNLMGPGPWNITRNISLPKTCGELHFTNKNKKSNITVSHTLKIIFRVQRGDDQEIDKQTGKRKMFDIVVQTPIHILSVSLFLTSFTRSALTLPWTVFMWTRLYRPSALLGTTFRHRPCSARSDLQLQTTLGCELCRQRHTSGNGSWALSGRYNGALPEHDTTSRDTGSPDATA